MGGIWVSRGHVRENIWRGGTMAGLPSPAIHRAYAKRMTVICPPLEEYEQAAMPPPAGGDFSGRRDSKCGSAALLRSVDRRSRPRWRSSRVAIPWNRGSASLASHPQILFTPVNAYGFGRFVQPLPIFSQSQNVER